MSRATDSFARMAPAKILVRGANDIASAVVLRLFHAGYALAIHVEPDATTTRRGMAFADAVSDGRAILDGVTALRVDDLEQLPSLMAARAMVPLTIAGFTDVVSAAAPDVLVDARMRKRARPEIQRGLAALTVGLGPNFEAGVTTDVAIETSWEELGRIITEGATLPLRGEPRAIAGHARDRYVYAPIGGVFRTTHGIGDRVQAGEPVGAIESTPIAAPLDGVLRGIARDGVRVAPQTKIIEVDPRGDPTLVEGVAERPGRIADAVLTVVSSRHSAAHRREGPASA